jgi:hypothetical protein
VDQNGQAAGDGSGDGAIDVAALRLQYAKVHSLTLIESAARLAREQLCEAAEYEAMAAHASDVVSAAGAPPAVVARLNGGVGEARGVTPVLSDKQKFARQAAAARAEAERSIANAVNVAVRLGRMVGMIE